MSPKENNPEYSRDREFKVILEEFKSDFRVFGEGLQIVQDGLQNVQTELKQVSKRLERVEIDVAQIKSFLPHVITQTADHERRITVLERSH